jgi:hypothetical protein
MNFRLGRRIGLLTKEPAAHYAWLRASLPGAESLPGSLGLAVGGLELHLSPSTSPHLVVEAECADAEVGRRRLRGLGGVGLGGAFVIDSFGLPIQVAVREEEFVMAAQEGAIAREIGLTCDSPSGAAGRYGRLFGSEPYMALNGDWIVGSEGPMLRLRSGMPGRVFLVAYAEAWSRMTGGLDPLDFWTDPFGFHWSAAPSGGPSRAETPVS